MLYYDFSTAQLLEPFCRDHDIQVSLIAAEMERNPTVHSGSLHSGPPGSSAGGELEDPPGLYEKVSANDFS